MLDIAPALDIPSTETNGLKEVDTAVKLARAQMKDKFQWKGPTLEDTCFLIERLTDREFRQHLADLIARLRQFDPYFQQLDTTIIADLLVARTWATALTNEYNKNKTFEGQFPPSYLKSDYWKALLAFATGPAGGNAGSAFQRLLNLYQDGRSANFDQRFAEALMQGEPLPPGKTRWTCVFSDQKQGFKPSENAMLDWSMTAKKNPDPKEFSARQLLAIAIADRQGQLGRVVQLNAPHP